MLAKWTHRYGEWRASRALPQPPATDEHGVAIPPAFLITIIGGRIDWEYFLKAGRLAIEDFAAAVDRNGGDFQNAERILDFGCGCGRLARHAPMLTNAEFHGVDYNDRLVRWCAKNLRGNFSRNALHPPLQFPDAHFDALYALSVFTHLRRATQDEWLAEFARVVRPGGFALVTFHDEDHARLSDAGIDRAALIRDGFAIANDKAEGSNLIASFQTRDFARAQFSAFFDVVEFVPCADTSIAQAIAVLRRR